MVKNLHVITWPTPKVLAFSTTRFPPQNTSSIPHNLHDISSCQHKIENSPKAFDFFNLGTHVGDNPKAVEHNRNLLLNYLPQNSKIQWLEQVHGNHVAYINEHSKKPIIADAAITNQKQIALAVMTADCLPVLLADKHGHEVAVIHAGWRPLAANIIKETIAKMQTPTNDIVAWFGPCISANAFQVGDEVKQQFIAKSSLLSTAFTPLNIDGTIEKSTKFLADLIMIAKLQLNELGVNNIVIKHACTFTQSNQYYSYRKEGITGRMASVISLT